MTLYGLACWLLVYSAVQHHVKDYCERSFTGTQLEECLAEMPIARNERPGDWITSLTPMGELPAGKCTGVAAIFFYVKNPHIILN